MCARPRALVCVRALGRMRDPRLAGVCAGTSVVSLDESVSLSFLARRQRARGCTCFSLCLGSVQKRVSVLAPVCGLCTCLGGERVCLRVSACAYLCECGTRRVCVLDFHECCVFKDLYCVGACVLKIQEYLYFVIVLVSVPICEHLNVLVLCIRV